MKIRVNFTVDVDLDEYNAWQKRACGSDEFTYTATQLRNAMQNTAADAIGYHLGDNGIAFDIIHNN